MPRLRRSLGAVGLAAASLGVVAALAEVGARLLWTDSAGPPRAGPTARGGHGGLPVLRTVAEAMKPGARGIYQGAPFETNRRGFRGPEVAVSKPPGTFRIVVIGDSVTMGGGVPRELTYPARAEAALRASRSGLRVEVHNLGRAGLDAWGNLQRLQDVGLPLEPDLVVYGFTLNDIEGPHYQHSEDGGETYRRVLRARADRSPSYAWRLLRPRIDSLRELIDPPAGSYVRVLDENYFENEQAWAHLVSAFGTLARLASDLDVCALVLVHTKLYYLHGLHPFRRHYDEVEQSARPYGLPVVQSLPHFTGATSSDLWLTPRDAHPNAEGHRVLAEALLEGLEALPPRCWQR